MKISNELRNKLNSQFNKQTKALTKPLEEKAEKIKQEIEQQAIKEVTAVLENYLTVAFFIKSHIYRYTETTPEDMVKNQRGYFVNHECTNDIEKEIHAIHMQRQEELESILVELTYGKDIKDIKAVFERYNLTF